MDNPWVNDTSFYNAVNQDYLVDWMQEHHSDWKLVTDSSIDFSCYVSEINRQFVSCYTDKYLIHKLAQTDLFRNEAKEKKWTSPLFMIPESARRTATSEWWFKLTKMLRDASVPCILFPALQDGTERVRCYPTLLLRQDYVPLVYPNVPFDEKEKGYVAVLVRFVTLPLRVKPLFTLMSHATTNHYAIRCLLHARCLGAKGSILVGRSLKQANGAEAHIRDCRQSYLYISEEKYPKFTTLLDRCISWRRTCLSRGAEWSLGFDPTSTSADDSKDTSEGKTLPLELYPNMCKVSGPAWQKIKTIIAKRLHELTLLWNVTVKQRNAFHAMNPPLKSFLDPRCDAKLLFPTSKERCETMQNILSVIREKGLLFPEVLRKNVFGWKNIPPEDLELYVDFETRNAIYDDFKTFPFTRDTTMIFMIGAGYMHPLHREWICKVFVARNDTLEEEARIIREWLLFMETACAQYHTTLSKVPIWVYSKAEETVFESQDNPAWDRVKSFWEEETNPNLQWHDLKQVIAQNKIAIQGCYNYSLKSIVKALHALGWIDETWPDSEVDNGLTAMVVFCRLCRKMQNVTTHPLMQQVEAYNRVDVRSMYLVLTFLRRLPFEEEHEEEEEEGAEQVEEE